MKNTFAIILGVALVMSLHSCKKVELSDATLNKPSSENFEQSISQTRGVPFSDTTALAEFDADLDILRFDYARKVALIDMIVNDSFTRHGWSDCSLAKSPVAIYGFDNRPLFYDFVVISPSGEARGVVTVHARRRSAMPIKAMTQGVDSYGQNAHITRSIPGAVYFADIRGNRYVAPQSKSGESVGTAINISSGEKIENCTFASDEEMLATIRRDVLPQIFPDAEQCRAEGDLMEARMHAQHHTTEVFWNALSNFDADIAAFSERADPSGVKETFDNILADDGGGGGGGTPITPPLPQPTAMTVVEYDDGCSNVAWLKEYSTWFKRYNHRGEFCGPWVAGFILSANYNQDIKPSQFDKPGYTVQDGECVENILSKLRGAMTAPCLNNALKDYSNGAVQIGMTSILTNEAYWRIRRGESVVRLFINWPVGPDWGWHWTHLYGSHRTERAFSISIYFMQADNGTKIIKNMQWRYDRDERDANNYDTTEWLDSLFPVTERKTIKS